MQVVRQLRAQIASGELAEGERIPSQRQMMAHWRISMQTASKVIGALKAEGLAIASAGRDTVVAPGAASRIATAAAGAMPADEETAESLGIPPGTPVHFSRARHYTSTGQIIGYAETSTTAGRWQSR